MARGKRYQPEQVVNLLRQIEVTTSTGAIVLPSSSIARAPRSNRNAVPRGAQRIGGTAKRSLRNRRLASISCSIVAVPASSMLALATLLLMAQTRCLYFEGVSRAPGTDPWFLQIKEEAPSAYASFLP